MNKEKWIEWSGRIREELWHHIRMKEGFYDDTPDAIVVSGIYRHALMEDFRSIQYTTEGGVLWRGIPLVVASGENKVEIAWRMEEVKITPPPKEVE